MYKRQGIAYLFTDTAGLRHAGEDVVEAIGIDRAREAMEAADILLWLGDEDAPVIDGPTVLALHPRCDLSGRDDPSGRLSLSAETGFGIDALWDAIGSAASARLPTLDRPVLNRRQRALASDAHSWLTAGISELDMILVGECLRAARAAFDRITGRADVEAMLDSLFSRFCIGK